MEKTIVFLPIIIFFSIFTVLIFLFIGLVLKLLKKQRDSYWIGEIIDKKHTESRDFDTNDLVDTYYMVVKCDDGKERKAGLSSSSFNDFQVGDRVEKKKGDLHPKKI